MLYDWMNVYENARLMKLLHC